MVLDVVQRGYYGGKINVSSTRCAPVAIDKMDMTNRAGAKMNRLGNGALFDVHVEKVGQQADVSRLQAVQAAVDSARLMLGIAHGEVICAARADLWASSVGQVDTRSSARTQNPGHQVG